jgi:CRP/FNR family transcriptional regulator, cyclic AMP receptor protein
LRAHRDPRENIDEVVRLIAERIGGSDALYHDANDTALVTIVAQDILRGWLVNHAVSPKDWLHAIIAALYHFEFREREYIRHMAVTSPHLKAFLVATPFFGGLSDASLDLLISMLVERRFDVGVTVVAEGEPGRSMYIVHSGELAVSKIGASGRAIRMSGLRPGDFFGEMTLIEMQNRSATVVTESPTVLYELTARNLYTYYKADIYAYVMVIQNINRELCRRLRRADNRIAELADAARGK